MSRVIANHTVQNSTSAPKDSSPKQQPHWRERVGNKRKKKRVLQGEAVRASKRRKTKGAGKPRGGSRKTKRRNRTRRIYIPIMSSLIDCCAELKDPRVNRRRRHVLIDIVVISVLAVMCNSDTWKDIQTWGAAKHDWLRSFLELPNGIPSRDTFRRTISRIDPDQLQQVFLRWLSCLTQGVKGVVAIDGKTLRRSRTAKLGPLHIVSAWAAEEHLTLGQRTVDGKSNEITAIPELLATLALEGATITIDAMGCQKNIAAQIVDAKGDYSLAVKDNQPTLAEDIATGFTAALEAGFKSPDQHELETHDKGHGRTETRLYYTMPVPASLRTAKEWKGMKSVGMTVTYRQPDRDGEVRYYINSFESDAQRFANAVRSHWGIENSLHWVMDVTFREDESRIHKDHGAENFSWLRRIAISLIKRDTTIKDSIRAKRFRAACDFEFFQQMLGSIASAI